MAKFMGRSRIAPASSNGSGVKETPSPSGAHANGNGTTVNGDGATAAAVNGDGAATPHANGDGAATPAAGESLRDKLGRYRVDNPGGPGNPFGRHVARNRRILLAAVSNEEVEALFRKLYEMGMGGDRGAIKLLLEYLVGKPVPASNPDRTNHEEWELRMQQPTPEERAKQNDQLHHAVVLPIHQAMDLYRARHVHETLTKGWAEQDAQKEKQRERAERRAQRKAERQRRKKGG
jgi:hypothetical protein